MCSIAMTLIDFGLSIKKQKKQKNNWGYALTEI